MQAPTLCVLCMIATDLILCVVLAAIGIIMVASPLNSQPVLFAAILIIGMSYGSESNITGYLIGGNFGVQIYSTVFGITSSVMIFGTACGGVLHSTMVPLVTA